MKELAYTDLRFKSSPIRRRIFWAALVGVLVSYFLGNYILEPWLPFLKSSTVANSIQKHLIIPVRTLLFLCAALLTHLVLVWIEPPRFQFSLMQLLIASATLAVLTSVLIFPPRISTQAVSRTESALYYTYGWPLQLCTIIQYSPGQESYVWQKLNCALTGSFIGLTTLNILFFKLPKSPTNAPRDLKASEPRA